MGCAPSRQIRREHARDPAPLGQALLPALVDAVLLEVAGRVDELPRGAEARVLEEARVRAHVGERHGRVEVLGGRLRHLVHLAHRRLRALDAHGVRSRHPPRAEAVFRGGRGDLQRETLGLHFLALGEGVEPLAVVLVEQPRDEGLELRAHLGRLALRADFDARRLRRVAVHVELDVPAGEREVGHRREHPDLDDRRGNLLQLGAPGLRLGGLHHGLHRREARLEVGRRGRRGRTATQRQERTDEERKSHGGGPYYSAHGGHPRSGVDERGAAFVVSRYFARLLRAHVVGLGGVAGHEGHHQLGLVVLARIVLAHERAQRGQGRFRRGGPLLGLLRQQAIDPQLEPFAQLGPQRAQLRRGLREVAARVLGDALEREDGLARQQQERDAAHGVEVARGDRVPQQLLGRHEAHAAHGHRWPREHLLAALAPRHAEVEQLDARSSSVEHEDVAGLQVAVNHARFVRGAQRVEDPLEDEEDVGQRRVAHLQEHVERQPGQQLHHQVRPPLAHQPHVGHRHDAGVANVDGGARLFHQAAPGVELLGLFLEHLDGDPALAGLVLRFVHLAHRARADEAQQPVAGDHRAFG